MTPSADPLWFKIVAVFASPAMFGVFLLVFNNRFNDINHRIGDLRNQMQREHDTLAKKVDALSSKVDTLLGRDN